MKGTPLREVEGKEQVAFLEEAKEVEIGQLKLWEKKPHHSGGEYL